MKKYLDPNASLLSEVKDGYAILSASAKRRMGWVTTISASLSILDLIAVGLLGLSASIAVRGVQSQEVGFRGKLVTDLFGISNYSLSKQVLILTSAAVILFLIKTIATAWLSRKIIYFVQREAARSANNLLTQLFSTNYNFIREKSIQERIYSTTSGVNSLVVGVVGALFLMLGDIILLLILVVGLIYLDPFSGSVITLLFILTAYSLNLVFHKRASELGRELSTNTVQSNEAISELLTTMRERIVRGTNTSFLELIHRKRLATANLQAEMRFIPTVSKYVFEIGLVFITVTVTLIQFYFADSSRAVANLVVFLAASGRIAPAILRLQQGFIGIRNNLGSASPTQQLIKDIQFLENRDLIFRSSEELPIPKKTTFTPEVLLKNVSFRYSNSNPFSIENLDIAFPPHSFTAIVGQSGAGKSTLFELCLGFLTPSNGSVLISNQSPNVAIKSWPGKVGYVPQDSIIVKNSLRENILLGIKDDYTTAEWESLVNSCGLKDLVDQLPFGLDTNLGEFGSQLSGGQKQRIGIARAMIHRPQLVFFDEVTSSLDAETEHLLTRLIYGTREERKNSNRTVIAIAHRISSIRNADNIVFMENGSITGIGTFEELLVKLPSFTYQAKLMGLR